MLASEADPGIANGPFGACTWSHSDQLCFTLQDITTSQSRVTQLTHGPPIPAVWAMQAKRYEADSIPKGKVGMQVTIFPSSGRPKVLHRKHPALEYAVGSGIWWRSAAVHHFLRRGGRPRAA
jgi:hypothetical protein